MYIKQTKCSLNIEPSIDYMALKLENGLNGNACWKNRNPKVEKYGALMIMHPRILSVNVRYGLGIPLVSITNKKGVIDVIRGDNSS